MLDVTTDSRVVDLALGLVESTGLRIAAGSEDLRGYCEEVARRATEQGLRGGEERREGVRRLLRAGGFKPSGRNKPAQEYLLRAVIQDGAMPSISNAVDVINAVSLDCGLPISLVAVGRAGTQLTVRYGGEGERYVFNRAGQDLDLEGLLCLCGECEGTTIPLGTPVKDSMAAKVTGDDAHVLACIYAPRLVVGCGELRQWTDRLGEGFERWCGAAPSRRWLVPEAW